MGESCVSFAKKLLSSHKNTAASRNHDHELSSMPCHPEFESKHAAVVVQLSPRGPPRTTHSTSPRTATNQTPKQRWVMPRKNGHIKSHREHTQKEGGGGGLLVSPLHSLETSETNIPLRSVKNLVGSRSTHRGDPVEQYRRRYSEFHLHGLLLLPRPQQHHHQTRTRRRTPRAPYRPTHTP